MTKSWQSKPSGVPLGINICWGQPHPQKLNCAKASPPTGRFKSKLRKVLSNGIVTEDSVEFLVMVFSPWRTFGCKTKLIKLAAILEIWLTIDDKSIKFDEEQSLVLEQPRIPTFIYFGAEENPAGASLVTTRSIVDGDVVGKRLMIQMGESGKDGTTRLEIHTAGHVHVRLLPESIQSVRWTTLALYRNTSDSNSRIIQLKIHVETYFKDKIKMKPI